MKQNITDEFGFRSSKLELNRKDKWLWTQGDVSESATVGCGSTDFVSEILQTPPAGDAQSSKPVHAVTLAPCIVLQQK